jgi:hypothetical protein
MRSSLPTRPSPPVAWWAPSLSLFTVGWNKAQSTGRQLRKLREPWLITTPAPYGAEVKDKLPQSEKE